MDQQGGHRLDGATTAPGLERWGTRDLALLKMVERHVLPRLALRAPALVTGEGFGDGLSERVPRMTDFALSSDRSRSEALLRRLHRQGMTFSQLQIGLLAPSARRLNTLWEADDISFLDVTLAAGNLQRMMRFVALDLIPLGAAAPRGRSILIGPAPGDGHRFGAAMAAEYFRRDGWEVLEDRDSTADSLAEAAAARWVDVLGLSVTTDGAASGLDETIRRVRQASVNPRLLVIAAGEALARDPELLARIGADATLAALPTAPARAHRLVEALFGERG